jgi:hypothetical protein
MSDKQLKEMLDKARREGVAIFKVDDIEKTRQRLYRIIREEKKGHLPLFPPVPVTLKTTKQVDEIMILAKKEEKFITVQPDTPEVIEQIQRQKQIKKSPLWIKRWREEIQQAEEQNPTFVQGNPNCKDAWEYFDTLKFLMDLYMDLDNEDESLEKAIRGTYEEFTKNLIAAFIPQYKPKPPELTRREELAKRMGEIRNSHNPADVHEFRHLLEEHERLVKREDEQWTDPKNLLG